MSRALGRGCAGLVVFAACITATANAELPAIDLLEASSGLKVAPATAPGFGSFVSSRSDQPVRFSLGGAALGYFTETTTPQVLVLAAEQDAGGDELTCTCTVLEAVVVQGELVWQRKVAQEDSPWCCGTLVGTPTLSTSGLHNVTVAGCVTKDLKKGAAVEVTLGLQTADLVIGEGLKPEAKCGPVWVRRESDGHLSGAWLAPGEQPREADKVTDAALVERVQALALSSAIKTQWDAKAGVRTFTSSDTAAMNQLRDLLDGQELEYETKAAATMQSKRKKDETEISFGPQEQTFLVKTTATGP